MNGLKVFLLVHSLFVQYYYKARQMALRSTHPEVDEKSLIMMVSLFLEAFSSLKTSFRFQMALVVLASKVAL